MEALDVLALEEVTIGDVLPGNFDAKIGWHLSNTTVDPGFSNAASTPVEYHCLREMCLVVSKTNLSTVPDLFKLVTCRLEEMST